MVIFRSYMLHGIPITTRTARSALDAAARSLLRPIAAEIPPDADTSPGITVCLGSDEPPDLPAGGRPWMTAQSLRLLTDERDSYLLLDDRLFGVFSPTDQRITAWIPPALAHAPDFVGQMIVLPLLLEALRTYGFVSVHAAALAHNGRAVLFPAASGGGKTTLTLALLRAGFRLLSDDCPLLRRTDAAISAYAFAEPLNIVPSTAEFFPELRRSSIVGTHASPESETPDAAGVAQGREKIALDPVSVYGECVTQQCPPGALVFPAIGSEDRTRLEPLAAPEALLRLLALAMPSASRLYLRQQLDLLGDLVSAVPCYTLATGRDFDRLPDVIRTVLAA